jgi:hypothetical protein
MNEFLFIWAGRNIVFEAEDTEGGRTDGHVCPEGERWGWSVVAHQHGRNEPAVLAEGQADSEDDAKAACIQGWLNYVNRRVMSRPLPEELFYIRSLKHERGYGSKEHTVIWWAPNQRGYTNDVKHAGRYPRKAAEEICGGRNAEWLGEGKDKRLEPNNVMVPVDVALILGQLVVDRSALERRMLELAADSLAEKQ